MGDIDLDAIRARADAATPGPWEADDSEVYVATGRAWVAETLKDNADQTAADSAFIGHARSDIPALLDEVARLQGHCLGRDGALRILGDQIEEFRADATRLTAERDAAVEATKQGIAAAIEEGVTDITTTARPITTDALRWAAGIARRWPNVAQSVAQTEPRQAERPPSEPERGL